LLQIFALLLQIFALLLQIFALLLQVFALLFGINCTQINQSQSSIISMYIIIYVMRHPL
jgi:small-conductance mechanosensitive channel